MSYSTPSATKQYLRRSQGFAAGAPFFLGTNHIGLTADSLLLPSPTTPRDLTAMDQRVAAVEEGMHAVRASSVEDDLLLSTCIQTPDAYRMNIISSSLFTTPPPRAATEMEVAQEADDDDDASRCSKNAIDAKQSNNISPASLNSTRNSQTIASSSSRIAAASAGDNLRRSTAPFSPSMLLTKFEQHQRRNSLKETRHPKSLLAPILAKPTAITDSTEQGAAKKRPRLAASGDASAQLPSKPTRHSYTPLPRPPKLPSSGYISDFLRRKRYTTNVVTTQVGFAQLPPAPLVDLARRGTMRSIGGGFPLPRMNATTKGRDVEDV